MFVASFNNGVEGSSARGLRVWGILLAWVAFAGFAAAAEPLSLSKIDVRDVNGKTVRPFDLRETEQKAVLLIFTTHDCPIANAYAPEIKRIGEEYEPKGVRLFLVHVDPDLSADAAKKHAADFGFNCPVLLDPSHALVAASGATLTPEAALFDRDGKIQYLGRIDDHYAAYMKKRAAPTRRDLREALNELLAGKPISVKKTEPIGCYIPVLEGAKK